MFSLKKILHGVARTGQPVFEPLTDPGAVVLSRLQKDARDIPKNVAGRWTIDAHFHDVKEIWGAGQQWTGLRRLRIG